MLKPFFVLFAALALASHARAQAANERLIMPLPAPFKPAGEIRMPSGSTAQIFRPPGQTDDNWTAQIVLQTGPARAGVKPIDALHVMEKQFDISCKDHAPISILPGTVNGYSTATAFFKCPLVAATGKPESSVVHVIAGTDKVYIILQTVHAVPAQDQIKQMIAYLGTVKVCDDRTAEHPCPKP